MNKEQAADVKDHCMNLLTAKKTGKITQEQMDFELAKLTLEMLDSYAPVYPFPEKERVMIKWASLTNEERKKMEASDFEQLEEDYKIAKKRYNDQIEKIKDENNSNLFWLMRCGKILIAKDHPGAFRIGEMIKIHNDKNWSLHWMIPKEEDWG